MSYVPPFVAFRKIPRLSRACVITEKLDGTNAMVFVGAAGCLCGDCDPRGLVLAGSRSEWLFAPRDNHGFRVWVDEHAAELRGLGLGVHYGEWWGQGINRKYGLSEMRFSLFNVSRWGEPGSRPACCHVVPVLYAGEFSTVAVDFAIDNLRTMGSSAAPGFMKPEGVIVYHVAGNLYFKKTLDKDAEWKGLT